MDGYQKGGGLMDKITNAEDYEKALDRINELMDMNPGLGSPEGKELDSLVALVQDYECGEFDIK
jgi:HTH-type transcriptional regulator/antitoxin HigA